MNGKEVEVLHLRWGFLLLFSSFCVVIQNQIYLQVKSKMQCDEKVSIMYCALN